jgi:hypothetical protein
MRQARHETETERIAVRKEHYWNSTDRVLRGQGAQGAPDGDRVRTEADQNRPPSDPPIEG